jgi:hypothetical protein
MKRDMRLLKTLLRSFRVGLVACLGLIAIVGTGGGGGDGAAGPGAIEGVWRGSKVETVYLCIIFVCTPDHKVSSPASALASRRGKLHLIPGNILQLESSGGLVSNRYAGRVQVSGSAVTGTIRGTCDPLDGPPSFGNMIIDGSVASGVALDLNYDLDECVGSGVYNLDFYKGANKPASLGQAKGQWSSAFFTLNVDKDGAFLGATGSGCQLSGNLSPASSNVNIYDASVQVENCGYVNGTYTGLAAIFPDTSDRESLFISATGSSRTIAIAVKR